MGGLVPAWRAVVAAVFAIGLAVAPAAAVLHMAPAAATGRAAADGPPGPAQPVLAPLAAADAPAVDPAVLSGALAPLIADPALGPEPGVVVLDVADGAALLQQRADVAIPPASSLKIVTGLAALAAYGPQARLATRLMQDADGSLVLVGGGDPMLTTVEPDLDNPSGAASLADLAESTAAAMRSAGMTTAALRYDAGLFEGPALSPDWAPSLVPDGIVSPVSALTLRPGSPEVDPVALDADPAGTAASWFAARLSALGVAVDAVAPGGAGPDAEQVAQVQSAPMAALVDVMLDESDNDIAEALFRLAALGRGLPATFDGGAEAVAATIADIGVPAPGLVVRDGSGLSRSNLIAPQTLVDALLLAVDPHSPADDSVPAPGAVSWLPSGLPVGALTGSLADRFTAPDTDDGAGRVHAKTGTLTGVTSLTGQVATRQGRPLVFAVLGAQTPDTIEARDALDRIAATLAACGCRAPAA